VHWPFFLVTLAAVDCAFEKVKLAIRHSKLLENWQERNRLRHS
jgi:hypothetical protein